MTRAGLEELLERVSAWPEEAQEELAVFIADVEARHSSSDYELTAEDLAALDRSLADVKAGRFAPDGAIEALFNRYFK
jgi:hypothetical protein